MELPEAFSAELISLIGKEEYERYVEELGKPGTHGLRANRLKITSDELKVLLEGCCRLGEPVPWCDDGYYFDIDPAMMPGKLAYYLAGLYYIQEPSAMYPAANAMIKPGENVIDLCAAPGGKSLRAASDLGGKGMLVSNDISATRAGTLLYNLELGGVANAAVTNCAPEQLAERFGQYFDAVLVDAPCSGEGMFRKDPDAIASWENFKAEKCAGMQRSILNSAAELVRPGGRIMYSTCTFEPLEDEQMTEEFLKTHPGFELVELPKTGGVCGGEVNSNALGERVSYPVRLWPHRLRGEGQYAALFVKKDGYERSSEAFSRCASFRVLKQYPEELRAFAERNLTELPLAGNTFYVMGQNLYACPFEPVNIDRMKVLRMGLFVGELSYGKLRPSQHFIMSLNKDSFVRKLRLDPFGDEIKRYLKGESLPASGSSDGFTAVCAGDYQLGGGDVKGGMLKNLYPKGWRRII
ncbi:MAG: RsmF rRNA methyltransferase first C-terminal domain-containing protein [Clostridia bacterium]|nr:RsmF rRNA methyltransferase first C-terminal domain-containing protein [Clostridia bacterium]